MLTQVIVINTTKRTDTISANHLKPAISTCLAVASAPAIALPMALTIMTVKIVIRAEPAPAQERARVVRPSLSLPVFVKAGIIDQYGISIMV